MNRALLCLLLLLFLRPLSAQEGPDLLDVEPELPSAGVKQFAAAVGTGQITLDQVLEEWGPSWYQVIGKVRSGRLAPNQADGALQQEWTRALDIVIREEIFYQEAMREHEKMIVSRARAIHDGQRSSRGNNGPPLRVIEREIRRRFNKSVERQLNYMIDRYIKASGGLENLKKVISRRDITWSEWRERLQRKAFTDQYLHSILGPRVPRDARPADIRNYYRDNPDEFTEPGLVIFRHILFGFEKRGGEEAARSAANDVYDALMEKRFTFAEAAKRFSDDEKSKAGGGLENAISPDPAREAWLSNIREALRSEKPKEIGPMLISPAGCHLVMLEQVQPGTKTSFREAQKTIARKLYSSKWEVEAGNLYKELRKAVRVDIKTPRFPDRYSWKTLSRKQAGRRTRHIGPASLPDL